MKKKKGALLTTYQKNEATEPKEKVKKGMLSIPTKRKKRNMTTQQESIVQQDLTPIKEIKTSDLVKESKDTPKCQNEMQQRNPCIWKDIKETKKMRISSFSEIDYHYSTKRNKRNQNKDYLNWCNGIKQKE